MGNVRSQVVQNNVTKDLAKTSASFNQTITRSDAYTAYAGGTISLIIGPQGSCNGLSVSQQVTQDVTIKSQLNADQKSSLKASLKRDVRKSIEAEIKIETAGARLNDEQTSIVQNMCDIAENYFEGSAVQGIDVDTTTYVQTEGNIEITLNGKINGPCEINQFIDADLMVSNQITAAMTALFENEQMKAVIQDASAKITSKKTSFMSAIIAGAVAIAIIGAVVVAIKASSKKKKKGTGRNVDITPRDEDDSLPPRRRFTDEDPYSDDDRPSRTRSIAYNQPSNERRNMRSESRGSSPTRTRSPARRSSSKSSSKFSGSRGMRR